MVTCEYNMRAWTYPGGVGEIVWRIFSWHSVGSIVLYNYNDVLLQECGF